MNEKINKKLVYHRALNDIQTFREFLKKDQNTVHTLVAEGDLCWASVDNECIIYIHHPKLHGKSLSDNEVESLYKKNELLTLEQLFSINSDIHYILELKTGTVDIEIFFNKLRILIEKYSAINILIDAFSVDYLKRIKTIIPNIKTSLHTKFVGNKYVLETTYEKPYVKMHNLYKLDFIDYITISYATTHVNLINLNIEKAYRHIYKSGKNLNFGAIRTVKTLKKTINSKVEYIYLRSDIVKNNYEKVLNNENNL